MEISKGKEVVEFAREVLSKTVHSSANLRTLEDAGSKLANIGEDANRRLKKVEEFNKNKVEETQRQKADYEKKKEAKQREMNNAQATLDAKHQTLTDNRNRLSSAQQDLRNAEDRLRSKKKEAEKAKVGAIAGSVLVGALTFGVGGALFGAAAGTILANAIEDLVIEVDAAKQRVHARELDCSNAQTSVNESAQQVSNINSQLIVLSGQKEQLERQSLEYHKKITQLKEVISFLGEAITFWEMFKHLSDHARDRTTRLKQIVEKAESEKNPGILQLNSTQRRASTLLDAWTEIETMVEDGSTNFTFKMEYNCAKCKESHNNLPYISEENCVCHNCHKAIKN